MCALSFVAVLVYGMLDKYAKKGSTAANVSVTTLKIEFRAFKLQYWLWVIIAVTIYSTIFPFLAIANDSIAQKWDISPSKSGLLLSSIDIIALIMSPIFGLIIDFTGKRGISVLVGNSLAVIGYLIIGATRLPPFTGIALLGIHFSLMPAALWPCLAFIVKEHEGLAFAIVSSLVNLSLTGIVPLAGWISDNYGFFWVNMLFASISGCSTVAALVWNWRDWKGPMPVLNQKVKNS